MKISPTVLALICSGYSAWACISSESQLNVAMQTAYYQTAYNATISVDTPYTFIVCPGRTYRVGTDKSSDAFILGQGYSLLDMTIQCGKDGLSSNNCIFLGMGGSIFKVGKPPAGSTLRHIYKGLTFDEYDEVAVSVATSKDSTVLFDDCVWRTSDPLPTQGRSATGDGLVVSSGKVIVRNSRILNQEKPVRPLSASGNRILHATGQSPWYTTVDVDGPGTLEVDNLTARNIYFSRGSSSLLWANSGSIIGATNGGILVVKNSNFTFNGCDIIKLVSSSPQTTAGGSLTLESSEFHRNESPLIAVAGNATTKMSNLRFVRNNFKAQPYSAIHFQSEQSSTGEYFAPVAELKKLSFEENYNMQHGVEGSSGDILLEDSQFIGNRHPYGALRSETSLVNFVGPKSTIRNTIFQDNDQYLTYIELSGEEVELEKVCVSGGRVMLAPFYFSANYQADEVYVDNVNATYCGSSNVVAERVTNFCLAFGTNISQCGPCAPLVGRTTQCLSRLPFNAGGAAIEGDAAQPVPAPSSGEDVQIDRPAPGASNPAGPSPPASSPESGPDSGPGTEPTGTNPTDVVENDGILIRQGVFAQALALGTSTVLLNIIAVL